jgi:hypothetical protein
MAAMATRSWTGSLTYRAQQRFTTPTGVGPGHLPARRHEGYLAERIHDEARSCSAQGLQNCTSHVCCLASVGRSAQLMRMVHTCLVLAHRLSSYWDVLTRPPPGTVVHLVRGERSDRWTPHMLQQLQEAEDSWQEHAAEAPEGVGQLQVR